MGMTHWLEKRRQRWDSRRDGERGGLVFLLLRLIINAVALLVTA